jgi:hypothetical protein
MVPITTKFSAAFVLPVFTSVSALPSTPLGRGVS